MAVKDMDIFYGKAGEKSVCSTYYSSPNRLMSRDLTTDNESATTSMSSKVKKKSPYLKGDRIQLYSHVTEKRIIQKSIPSFVSSFSLAADVYKADSDEFKLNKRSSKKNKKSILTLPNKQVVASQECTVSDPNDSGYFKSAIKNACFENKKRQNIKNNKSRNKVFEIYDRDAQYCSQLNINLDCSSSDIIKSFGRKRIKAMNKKNKPAQRESEENNAHNIWAILRKMNAFQFVPSPPDSEISIKKKKKRGRNKKYHNRRNTRYVESSTKEFAYVSNFEFSNSTFSRNTSCDRVTIIEEQKRNGAVENGKDYNREQICTETVTKCNNNDYGDAKQIKHYKKKNTTSHEDIKNKNGEILMSNKDAWNEKSSENKSNISSDELLPSSKSSRQLTNITQEDDFSKELYTIPTFFEVDNDKKIDFPLSGGKDLHNNSPVISNCSTAGATQLILNNVQNKQCTVRQNITHIKKPKLITTMPSVVQMPKLTRTEIRRRIANIKFPLVILERDQLSSSVEMINTDAIQFDGLNEHIWPFMLDWSEHDETEKSRRDYINLPNRPSECDNKNIYKSSMDRKINKLRDSNKSSTKSVKENKFDTTISNIKKIPIKTPLHETKQTEPNHRKPKSIYQLKEQVLSKNSFEDITGYDAEIKHCKDLKIIHVSNDLNKYNHSIREHIIDDDASSDKKCNKFAGNRSNTVEREHKVLPKYCRPRTKWVNEFIENVIYKIKSGVYFTEETKITDAEETTGSQTISLPLRRNYCESINPREKTDAVSKTFVQEPIAYETGDCLEKIGFDDAMPAIEIKSLNMKQITIRHCVTDVAVQFDIAIRKDTSQMLVNVKKTPNISCASVVQVENQINLFKCPTAILNAVLPAELCTVLPNIMRMIINKVKSSQHSPVTIDKTSQLSTISEIFGLESRSSLSPASTTLDSKLIISGKFWRDFSKYLPKQDKAMKMFKENSALDVKMLLPNLKLSLLFKCNIYHINYIVNKKEAHFASSNVVALPQPVKYQCKDIVLYTGPLKQFLNWNSEKPIRCNMVLPYMDVFRTICTMGNAIDIMRSIDSYTINLCPLKLFNNSIANSEAFLINEIKTPNIVSEIAIGKTDNRRPFKSIGSRLAGQSQPQLCLNFKKSRKNLNKYKKSKSMTSLNRKKSNTNLNNITNMEAFCRLLGSGKTLCSIFNENMETTILSAIEQMKKWISELSAKQALLILLLLNKKETPNLIRMRSILLQGIAVSRITRAVELDMEVEVIEREKINQYPQCEGISYLPSSIENKDSLLEELYWIAKTTASDYQRPFDEASEKLLNALLEKRKQLNPSYLRVMARYVGLGLLKPLSKKNSTLRAKF